MKLKIYHVSAFFKRYPYGDILRVHSFFEAENKREACLLAELSFSEAFKRHAFYVQATHVEATSDIRKQIGTWVWNLKERPHAPATHHTN